MRRQGAARRRALLGRNVKLLVTSSPAFVANYFKPFGQVAAPVELVENKYFEAAASLPDDAEAMEAPVSAAMADRLVRRAALPQLAGAAGRFHPPDGGPLRDRAARPPGAVRIRRISTRFVACRALSVVSWAPIATRRIWRRSTARCISPGRSISSRRAEFRMAAAQPALRRLPLRRGADLDGAAPKPDGSSASRISASCLPRPTPEALAASARQDGRASFGRLEGARACPQPEDLELRSQRLPRAGRASAQPDRRAEPRRSRGVGIGWLNGHDR